MKKVVMIYSSIVVASIVGCKSLNCGCPMSENQGAEVKIQEKQVYLHPENYPLIPINSNESRLHYHQKTCTD